MKLSVIALSLALVACPGAKTVVGATVKVDPQNCKEKDTSQGVNVILDCTTAEGSVTIEFSRAEWRSLLRSNAGSFDAGPGK